MNTRSNWIRGSLLVALVVGLVAVPEADAKGPRGGRPAARPARAPHVSAPRNAFKAPAFKAPAFKAPAFKAPAFKAPRMPRAAAPARAKAARATARGNAAPAHATHVNAQALASRAAMKGTVSPARSPGVNTVHSRTRSPSPNTNTFTYGSGTGARRYRAYGYGHGYRNRSYSGRSGYGRSQGHNRAIVARLRSVHAGLARLDHDYKGHRVRAMHAVSMAIRQLSHRSMIYSGRGFAPGMNQGLANGMRRGVGAGAGARRPGAMTQAQSDARMSQALRTLQGIDMQLSGQGYHTTGHARARGHVHRAIHELNTALAIR